ncbi:MAG: 16S rRNA (guanine(966)-N(2))-methyltransferase RsmD [Alphaproteobacteria bacterium]
MRIISGTFRGLALATPKDERIRPTSDRVREALFNVLAHNDFGIGFALPGARVLDLFAGTGALGLEALSRGAAFVMFVDDHFESRGLIRRNVEAAHATGATKIWRRDAAALGEMPANANGPFDLVFLDPPYRHGLAARALESLVAGGWLAPRCLLAVETAAGETLEVPSVLDVADERAYGDTLVRFLVTRSA